MIGQRYLQQMLTNEVETDRLARFTIIEGRRGSQLDQIAPFVAGLLGSELVVLTDVKVDTLRNMTSQAYRMTKKVVYAIDSADNMSPNARGSILKVVEEPPNNAYFIMTVENSGAILPTIRSRARILRMDEYSEHDLKEYALEKYGDKWETGELDIIKDTCKSPGEIDILVEQGVKGFYDNVRSIVHSLDTIGEEMPLQLTQNISVKDGDEKYDTEMSLRLFQHLCIVEGEKNKRKAYFDASFGTATFISDLHIRGINRQMLLDDWIMTIRRIFKNEYR